MDKKLSHRQYRKLIKKLKRKRIRQEKAKKRDENVAENVVSDFVDNRKAVVRPEDQRLRWIEDEEERNIAHQQWLAREMTAQKEFQKKKIIEERRIKEAKIVEQRIRDEWEKQQRKDKEEQEKKNEEVQKKKEREESLLRSLSVPVNKVVTEGPSHNPEAPPNYGTELDRENCPFFFKTGACRFGDRCSRVHFRPAVSCTLLIPKMYNHFSIGESFRDEYDTDIALEYDDNETYQHFREFYEDVIPEFKKIGRLIQFKTCCNHEPHLRGNVYVQYSCEEEALKALHEFNGRWYAGKQISCEFINITKWKSAICGLFAQNRCPKGKSCNFLHVFQNPRNEFFNADLDNASQREYKSSRSTRSQSGSQRSSKSVSSHNSSHYRRSRSPSRRDRNERRHETSGTKRSHSSSHSTRKKSKKHKKKSRHHERRSRDYDSSETSED